MNADAAVTELLLDRGADKIHHPGGTLLDHLHRVHAMLDGWGARPALGLAGLCHAFYGTDGFAVSLGETGRRSELIEVIGVEAERIVYLYAGCDRARTYPGLTALDGVFTDRFSGAAREFSLEQRRDFAELTVANELDVLHTAQDPGRYGIAALLDVFASWRPLLSVPAYQAVQAASR